ncbi:MAG: hypothetical protein ABIG96_00140 [Candidatus Micrarchaeota archaeon]
MRMPRKRKEEENDRCELNPCDSKSKRRELLSDFWDDERGQVSAEMLIIIAALIAVAIVLIGQLQSSAKTGAKNLNAKTESAWKEIGEIGK